MATNYLTGGLLNPQPNPVANALQAMGTRVFDATSYKANDLRDDSMEARVARISSTDSPIMQRAAQSGLNLANRRGLLNSSMAVGSAQAAVLDKALPIAQQDSSIAAQHNLTELEGRRQAERQAADNAAQLARQERAADVDVYKMGYGAQLQSGLNKEQADQEMSRLTYASGQEMNRLQAQLSNANEQQKREIEATMERLRFDTDAEMKRLTAAAGFDMARLEKQGSIDIERDILQAKNQQDLVRVQGTIQSALQAQGNTESIQRMGVELASNLQIQSAEQSNTLARIAATGDQELRRLVEAANQERETLRISLASNDRQAMAGAMVNIFQSEQALRQALLSNDKIPAAERAAYERSIAALGDPIRNYVNQLFSAPTGGAPTAPGTTTGGIGVPTGGGTNWGGEAPAAGIGGATANPVANMPVIDSGPTAGLVYQNGKFYDAAGNQVNPNTYQSPAVPAGIAPQAAPIYSAPTYAQEPVGGIGLLLDEELNGGGTRGRAVRV